MLLILALTAAAATAPPIQDAPPVFPLPPPLPIADAVKGSLRAVGTEPFWRLDIAGKTMVFVEPGDDGEKVQEFTIEYTTAMGDAGHIWTSGPLSVTMSFGECSDGMSDTVYPYSVEAILVGSAGSDTRTLKGCAFRPWGQDVLAALPVIDACLGISETKPPVVFAAATAADAGFAMLAGGDEDPLYTCTVAAGKAIAAPFEGDASPPGTNAELFVRGPGENPGGQCYDAPEVKDAKGNVVGWWLDPEGC